MSLAFPLILAACGGSPASPTSAEPAPAISAGAATSAPSSSSTASAPITPTPTATASTDAVVKLARLGATLQPPPGGAMKDGEKDAEIRGKGFVIKLHQEAERPKIVTAADARRQAMLRDAAEFGLRGLVSGVGDAEDDGGKHENVEATEIAPKEFVITDKAADHVHVYVWRRRPAGGWIWADCRAPKDALSTIRSACLTLTVTP